MKNPLFLFLVCLFGILGSLKAQPVITSFSPLSAGTGSSITITGSGFNTTAASNIVFVGGVQVNVTSASATQLIITLPSAATSSGAITVLNTATGLSAVSNKQFLYTFPGGMTATDPIANEFNLLNTGPVGPDLSGEGGGPTSNFRGVSADFDLDGKIDFAMRGKMSTKSINFYRNIGSPGAIVTSSSFAAAVQVTTMANISYIAPTTYDLNNDGKQDILMSGASGFSVLVNTSTSGNISFSRSDFAPGGAFNYQRCIAADMDRDGKLDIIAINPARGAGFSVTIYKNTSTGGTLSFNTSSPTQIALTKSYGELMTVDIDNDGDQDLVLSTDGNKTVNGEVHLLTNNNTSAGTMNMATSTTLITNVLPLSPNYYNFPTPLAFADFDGDGDYDIISAAKGSQAGNIPYIYLSVNNGGSFTTFSISDATTLYSLVLQIRIADLNGDGKPDILIPDANNANHMQVIMNNYSGGTISASSFANVTGFTPNIMSVGYVVDDFNNDGRVDVISNQYFANTLHYLTNKVADTFYAKAAAAANLSSLSSWSSQSDGTGISPSSFDKGVFILNNSSSTTAFTAGGNLSFGGKLLMRTGKTLTMGTYNLTINGQIESAGTIDGQGEFKMTGTAAQDLNGNATMGSFTVDNNAGVKLSGTVTANQITLSQGILTVTGALQIAGPISRTAGIVDATAGTVVFRSAGNQDLQTQFFSNAFINKIIVFKSSGLLLLKESNLTINDLKLDKGIFSIGDFDLQINGNVSNNSTVQYVRTSGLGKVVKSLANNLNFVFPVGNSTYNPLDLRNNTGETDVFSVRVFDDVLANGLDGNALTVPRAKRTWDISKVRPNIGAGIDLLFTWAAGDLSATLTTPTMYHFESGNWGQKTGTTTATSTTLKFVGYTGSFSPFSVMEANASLPLTWLGFTAQKRPGQVWLQWETVREVNTRDFLVQHSTNGIDWATAGSVAAKVNNTTIQSYHFEHNSPVNGNNYYRVLQRDIDGNSSYSKVVNILWEQASARAVAYPNPVINGILYIELPQPTEVILFASNGQVIVRKQLPAGIQTLQVDHIPKGWYLLQMGNQQTKVLVE